MTKIKRSASLKKLNELIESNLDMGDLKVTLDLYLMKLSEKSIEINRSEVARKFGVVEGTVRYRMKKLGL